MNLLGQKQSLALSDPVWKWIRDWFGWMQLFNGNTDDFKWMNPDVGFLEHLDLAAIPFSMENSWQPQLTGRDTLHTSNACLGLSFLCTGV